MSNGGIIGPIQDPTPGSSESEQITNFTSSGTYNPRTGQSVVDLKVRIDIRIVVAVHYNMFI